MNIYLQQLQEDFLKMKKKKEREIILLRTLLKWSASSSNINFTPQTILLHLLSNSPKKTHSKYHLPLSNTSISRQSSRKEGRPISQYCFFIIILNNSPWSNQIWIEPETIKSTVVPWTNRKKRKIYRQPSSWKTAYLANVSELSLHKLWDRI